MTTPKIRSAVASLPAYVPGARIPDGVQAFKVSSNENPYPPLPSVVDAITEAALTVNRYPDMGNTEMTDALAAFLSTPQREVSAERLAFGTGSVAALGHILSTFVDEGDEVVFPWRSFEAYPIVTSVAGGKSVRVPLTPDHRLDLDAMVEAVTDRTRVVLVCTPNNPTGTAVSHSQVLRFLHRIPDDVIVVLDEAYVEFVRKDDALDALALADQFPNVVVLRTFSKAYGLAGLRVGYVIAHPDIAAGIRAASTPFGVNLVAQVAVVASLRAADELNTRVDALIDERTRVWTALRELGWDVPPSQANFVWFPTGTRTEELAAHARTRGLLVRPFAGEGIRVTIGEPEANDVLLELAAEWLTQ